MEMLDGHDDDLQKMRDEELNLSELEQVDDLNSLNEDSENLDNDEFVEQPTVDKNINNIVSDNKEVEVEIFDVGDEEKKLVELSMLMAGKISDDEWDEISTLAQSEQYVVQEGDWLWKISSRLFGSGFYYSKIWSLNPHITNPHQIEPGMVLVFDTGDSVSLPNVVVGETKESSSDTNEVIKLEEHTS